MFLRQRLLLISLLSLLLLFRLCQSKEEEETCDIKGKCIDSDVISVSFAFSNAADCLRSCKQTPGCKWFTYNERGGEKSCELFRNCIAISEDGCLNCVTGYVECVDTFCHQNGFCQGHLLNDLDSASERECWLACEASERCIWLSFSQFHQKCYLFSTCPSLDVNTAGFVSSHAQLCSFYSSMSKLLVTTGFPYNEALKSEVIDLAEPANTCQMLNNFPVRSEFGTGGTIGNRPVVCGGRTTRYQDDLNCYVVDKFNTYIVAKLQEARESSAGLVVTIPGKGTKLWITGGDPDLKSTSELVSLDGLSESGPMLPEGVRSHCLVKFNDKEVMLIGGLSKAAHYSSNSHIYNFERQAWRPGPTLLRGRYDHACAGAFYDLSPLIVVAGGTVNGGYRTDSVEFFRPGNSNFWYQGPRLPEELCCNVMVTSPGGNGVILVGGFSPSGGVKAGIYELSCSSTSQQDLNCQWRQMPQRLQVARYRFVGMLIPDDMATCLPSSSLNETSSKDSFN